MASLLPQRQRYSAVILALALVCAAVCGNPLSVQIQQLLPHDEPVVSVEATAAPRSLTNLAATQQEAHFAAKRLNFDSIHRMLRDEHVPLNYRRDDSELRYYQRRASQPRHELHKRDTTANTLLNLSQKAVQSYNSSVELAENKEHITRIDLSQNQLTQLQLGNFSALRQLDLSQNRLTELRLPASSSAQLLTLDLSCNRLSQLESSFMHEQRLPQLKHLNLAHNHLGSVGREAFYNLVNLQTLLLSGNNITDIDYETFLGLPNLQFLDLSHNRLGGAAIRALQGIPDLVGLSIANNPEVGAAMQEFVASWSLKELDASGTGLCQVPAALAQSVRTLKLSDNWLKTINCGDLDSYPLLQYLDLSHSRIAQVEDDALGRLELLEVLFLDHNRLLHVPNSLPTSVEHLFLQHNRIMELQPQSFAALTSLETLDLSGNKLIYLPALPLPKLITLNLQGAGVESLSQGMLHTLPQLRDLLLEDNPIKCSDMLGIAEWASPCRNVDAGQPRALGKIDLKQQFVQLHNFYENFKSNCAGQATPAPGSLPKATDRSSADLGLDIEQQEDDEAAAICGQAAATTLASLPTTMTTTTTTETMPKVKKSKAVEAAEAVPTATTTTTTTTTQSTGNNIAALTTKTLRPTETTSLAKLRQQQMPSMPTATTFATKAVAGPTTTVKPGHVNQAGNSLEKATTAANIATAINFAATTTKTTAPQRHTISSTEISVASNTTLATTQVPQTILALIKSDKAPQQQQQQHLELPQQQQANLPHDNTRDSLLKRQTMQMVATMPSASHVQLSEHTSAEAAAAILHSNPAADAATSLPHKHAQLQLHIKDRHLIGTPLLMHKGDNLLVDAEQLLLPGTATVADANNNVKLLDSSQEPEPLPALLSDKRQPEAINVHKANKKLPKPKPSLSIKKMTYSTKHHATTTTSSSSSSSTTTTSATTTSTSRIVSHQHSSVNTPNALAAQQELNTFAQLKAYAELKNSVTESSKSAQLLLDRRQQAELQPLHNNHPGVVLLLFCVLFIVLLAGLAHVYRCEVPWQRRHARPGQLRPHHQRQFNEPEDAHSFLHYPASGQPTDPARLQKWHHSTRREAPYSSPLHNLHVRELQREQEKLRRCQQFYSASLSASGSGSSAASSRSSLHSPTTASLTTATDDNYYIEMAPSSGQDVVATNTAAASPCLPLELLNTRSLLAQTQSSHTTELGGTATMQQTPSATLASTATTLKSVSNKLMAPSSRRLGIW